MSCFTDFVLVVLALFIPPLPVMIRRGICSADTVINIALCCLGILPGVIHSWYIIANYPKDVVYDEEATIYYVPVSHQPQAQLNSKKSKKSKKKQRLLTESVPNDQTYSSTQLENYNNNPSDHPSSSTNAHNANSDENHNGPPPAYSELENAGSNAFKATDNKQSM